MFQLSINKLKFIQYKLITLRLVDGHHKGLYLYNTSVQHIHNSNYAHHSAATHQSLYKDDQTSAHLRVK